MVSVVDLLPHPLPAHSLLQLSQGRPALTVNQATRQAEAF
jgi:hypothetical protein